MTLQEFLDKLGSDGGDGPALAELTPDELAALGQEAQDRFAELRDGDLTPEALAEMERIADGKDALAAETTRRDTEAAETAARLEALNQRMGGSPGGDDDDEDDEPAPTAHGNRDSDGGDDPDQDDQADQDTPATTDRELVNASGRKAGVSLSAVRSRTAKPRLPSRAATLIAAADVPGVPSGTSLDMDSLAAAAERRFAAFPQGYAGSTQIRSGIAVIKRPYPKELRQTDGGDDGSLLAAAADQSRLPGNSLLAAGGWCAPSETLYDLCEPETTDGLVSVPEFQVKRGGIRYAESPLFSDIYSGVGFRQTEAQNIAGNLKSSYDIGCPDFEEVRLDALGVQITAGILQERGYPEMVQRVIRGALTAHAHKVNAYIIERLEALSTAVTAVFSGFGAWADTLAFLELQAVDVRYKYRLGKSSTLEGVGPEWLRPILRADLAVRNGVDLTSVTDAQLDAHFRERRISMQWVVDWQDAYVDGGTGLGGAAAATAYPTTAKVILYPAGTFTVGRAPVIQLDGIYDSTNIKSNSYTALFSEEAVLVARRCMQSRIVTLPELCPAGRTGAQFDLDCS